MSQTQAIGLHWFRRDLRIAGNTALLSNWKKNNGRVLGLFCFDSQFLSRPDFSHNRFAFFMNTLEDLKKELQAQGGDLLVVDELPHLAFPKIIQFLRQKKIAIECVTYNRDYEPFARTRDQNVETLLKDLKVDVESFRDHLLIEPDELFKGKPGEYYQVYSPFAKKWFELFKSEVVQKRLQQQKKGLEYLLEGSPVKDLFKLQWDDIIDSTFPYADQLDTFVQKNNQHVTVEIPATGSHAVRAALSEFKSKLQKYKEQRDIPSLPGTSKFSLYLKNGSLTSAQIICALDLNGIPYATENGPARFLKEIVWREFYYHILYHRPDVEKVAFNAKYNNIKWENDRKLFDLWCQGQTGFPIVDAGMRELNTTGWMHNRVRMIVASFLVKDLLIDWRWGEKYFMEKLLDGDLAPNNGGWQWAASTGCDPQPYFRIFNPWLQAERFDPEAKYIRQYVPELKKAPLKVIHKETEDRTGFGYRRPIVNHATQKPKALALFAQPEK